MLVATSSNTLVLKMNTKEEEARPELRAGDDRPAPPKNWRRRRARRGFATGLLWTASALVLAAVLAVFPGQLEDDRSQNLDDEPPNLSSAEIIRSLLPAPGTTGDESKPVDRSVDLDIRFDLNSAELLPEARRQLRALGSALTSEELKSLRFQIAGHTDASGSTDHNLKLSTARAEAVAVYLASEFDVEPSRLVTVGYGEEQLKTPAAPLAEENRRVEVRLVREPARAKSDTNSPAAKR